MLNRHGVSFSSYGVKIRLESSSSDLLKSMKAAADKALLGKIQILDNKTPCDHTFAFNECSDGTIEYLEDGRILTKVERGDTPIELFVRMLRFRVSEFAPEHVFLHAGAVGWKGKAIIVPANSGEGKTTLIIELVKLGAEYYSDEYAVFDSEGLVHPFARDLSVRTEGRIWSEKDGVPVTEFGGTAGTDPIPLGLVVFTSYESGAVWKPEEITAGNGMMEALLHTIPLRVNTEFSLNVLKNAFSRAIITRSVRGEACATAQNILSFCDKQFC